MRPAFRRPGQYILGVLFSLLAQGSSRVMTDAKPRKDREAIAVRQISVHHDPCTKKGGDSISADYAEMP